ncbi:MAG: DUF2997 domain-containing protein [Anaerolineaceae bacterium]|nr:DUF2997 domain-containing protein [Anaerolineaceae bacterium]
MNNQPHEIIIEIKPDGKISGEVKGVSGPHCAPLSEWLDELGEVLVDSQTPDYRKPSQQNVIINH